MRRSTLQYLEIRIWVSWGGGSGGISKKNEEPARDFALSALRAARGGVQLKRWHYIIVPHSASAPLYKHLLASLAIASRHRHRHRSRVGWQGTVPGSNRAVLPVLVRRRSTSLTRLYVRILEVNL